MQSSFWTKNLCRICANVASSSYNIFEKQTNRNIEVKMRRCFSLNIFEDDFKPRELCPRCYDRLDEFYRFVEMCHTSNYKFENVLYNLGRSAHMLHASWQEKSLGADVQLLADPNESSKILNVAEYTDLIGLTDCRDVLNLEQQVLDFGKTYVQQEKQIYGEEYEQDYVQNASSVQSVSPILNTSSILNTPVSNTSPQNSSSVHSTSSIHSISSSHNISSNHNTSSNNISALSNGVQNVSVVNIPAHNTSTHNNSVQSASSVHNTSSIQSTSSQPRHLNQGKYLIQGNLVLQQDPLQENFSTQSASYIDYQYRSVNANVELKTTINDDSTLQPSSTEAFVDLTNPKGDQNDEKVEKKMKNNETIKKKGGSGTRRSKFKLISVQTIINNMKLSAMKEKEMNGEKQVNMRKERRENIEEQTVLVEAVRNKFDEKRKKFYGKREKFDGEKEKCDKERETFDGSREKFDEEIEILDVEKEKFDEVTTNFNNSRSDGVRDKFDVKRKKYIENKEEIDAGSNKCTEEKEKEKCDAERNKFKEKKEKLDIKGNKFDGERKRLDRGRHVFDVQKEILDGVVEKFETVRNKTEGERERLDVKRIKLAGEITDDDRTVSDGKRKLTRRNKNFERKEKPSECKNLSMNKNIRKVEEVRYDFLNKDAKIINEDTRKVSGQSENVNDNFFKKLDNNYIETEGIAMKFRENVLKSHAIYSDAQNFKRTRRILRRFIKNDEIDDNIYKEKDKCVNWEECKKINTDERKKYIVDCENSKIKYDREVQHNEEINSKKLNSKLGSSEKLKGKKEMNKANNNEVFEENFSIIQKCNKNEGNLRENIKTVLINSESECIVAVSDSEKETDILKFKEVIEHTDKVVKKYAKVTEVKLPEQNIKSSEQSIKEKQENSDAKCQNTKKIEQSTKNVGESMNQNIESTEENIKITEKNLESLEQSVDAMEENTQSKEQSPQNTESTESTSATTKERKHTCMICSKKFMRKHNLNTHLALHRNDKPHACDLCEKKFVWQSELISHKRIHTDLYKCQYCSKHFSVPSKLERHRRTHTDARPFKCQEEGCQAAFSDKRNLQGHQVSHLRSKNFNCEICDKTYRTKNQLKTHLRVHSDEMAYNCDFCSKSFKWKKNLMVHLEKHDSFECVGCKLRFVSANEMGRHKKNCGNDSLGLT